MPAIDNGTDTSAPNFSVKIEGAALPIGVRQLTQRIEYESADGLADCLKLIVWDPDFQMARSAPSMGRQNGSYSGAGMRLVDSKIFQPGNEITISFGYGTSLKHIGRAIIQKMRPTYPTNDVPIIEVVAYTKDTVMMDNAPEKSKKVKGKGGRRFKNITYADAVRERAEDYGFRVDVDNTFAPPGDFIQKVGLSDYDFINGLANLTGYVFWVDGDGDGWTLHFKNPDKLRAADVQDRKYTFKYNMGDYSSLLSFEPEILLQGSVTKLKIQTKDPKTGRLIEVEFKEDNDQAPETRVIVSGETLNVVDQALNQPHTTASDIKIFLDDFSFEERSNRTFTTEAELISWGKQWFRRQRENFIMARGATIGTENLMARQTHALVGLGPTLDGDYYFSRVKHIMDSETGYMCDFSCRKVVPPLT